MYDYAVNIVVQVFRVSIVRQLVRTSSQTVQIKLIVSKQQEKAFHRCYC